MVDVPSLNGPMALIISGLVGDSTRRISAPKSASIMVAKGPGTSVVKSRIFKLDSACMMSMIPSVGE